MLAVKDTDWIETGSGLHYHFLAPQPNEITIEDIALALANKCRFSGHTQFFSVAEHSVCVAYRLPSELRLAGLLHDAAEAYLGDIPSPIKKHLPDYKALEAINEYVIAEKFGVMLTPEQQAEVKLADRRALFTEAHFLLPSHGKDWTMFDDGEWHVEWDFKPKCLPPVLAYKLFMDSFMDLTGQTKQLRLIGI